MTPDEIKKTWDEAARKIYVPTQEEYQMIYRNKKETALENLAKRYKKFSTLSLCMILCTFGWFSQQLLFTNESLRIASAVVMMIYFATCSATDWWLYKGISSINCFTMSVKEVIEKALYYRKKHLQSMMFLLPFAICVLGLMAYAMQADKYIILGMGAGAIVGLLIGYRQFTEFMKQYKIVSEQ